MSDIVHIDKAKLLLFTLPDGIVVEANELSSLLGYSEPGRLRRQIDRNWAKHFDSDDYRVVHDDRWLEKYEAAYIKHIADTITAANERRGRMFFTSSGVKKVLERTTRKGATQVEQALQKAGFFGKLQPAPAPEPHRPVVRTEELQPLVEIKRSLIEVRQHNYEVIQKLIVQLTDLQDDDLRLLAIEAAEIALGREFPDLRAKYQSSTTSATSQQTSSTTTPPTPQPPPKPVPAAIPSGPVFRDPTMFYSCKQIGQMAGGYSARTAGEAANVVGRRWGHTSEEIRTQQLSFNELPVLPDTQGKPRKMFRFNLKFANEVVAELRNNPVFRPQPGVATLSPFGGASSYPKLSKGPFSDEETAH